MDIYTASVDSHLNEHGYIIPGLGDADRIFGTRQHRSRCRVKQGPPPRSVEAAGRSSRDELEREAFQGNPLSGNLPPPFP